LRFVGIVHGRTSRHSRAWLVACSET
jgi:hypothetical protein